eukprot:1408653-Rhodomonas_salina.5
MRFQLLGHDFGQHLLCNRIWPFLFVLGPSRTRLIVPLSGAGSVMPRTSLRTVTALRKIREVPSS